MRSFFLAGGLLAAMLALGTCKSNRHSRPVDDFFHYAHAN